MRARRAFTLLELVIVISIFMVLTAVGFGLTTETMPRYRAKRAARNFQSSLNMCRMIAIETGYECRILLADFDSSPDDKDIANVGLYYIELGDSGLNAETFETLPTSLVEEDGTIDLSSDGDEYLKHVSIMDWGSIAGPVSSGSDSIVFSPRGFVTNPHGDFSDGYITISFVNKLAYSEGIDDMYQVQIARTGMTRVENPLEKGPYPDNAPATTSSSS